MPIYRTLIYRWKAAIFNLYMIVFLRFNEDIGITGAILTKMDGDTRGGAALSVR